MPRGAWGVLVWAGDAGMGGVRVVGSKVGLGVGVDQRGGRGTFVFWFGISLDQNQKLQHHKSCRPKNQRGPNQ